MSGEQIQHLYRRNAKGCAVYERTEVITVAHADYKTEILHIVIESLPSRDEVIELLSGEPETTLEGVSGTFYGVLPAWIALQ